MDDSKPKKEEIVMGPRDAALIFHDDATFDLIVAKKGKPGDAVPLAVVMAGTLARMMHAEEKKFNLPKLVKKFLNRPGGAAKQSRIVKAPQSPIILP